MGPVLPSELISEIVWNYSVDYAALLRMSLVDKMFAVIC